MVSELKEERIRKLAGNDRIAFKKPTALRMHQRGISSEEVKEALQNCKIIESYPNDYPFPSGLVVGYTGKKRAIHAVVVEKVKRIGILFCPGSSRLMKFSMSSHRKQPKSIFPGQAWPEMRINFFSLFFSMRFRRRGRTKIRGKCGGVIWEILTDSFTWSSLLLVRGCQ